MISKLTGIIIRSVDYGESDRILNILTAENGLVSVLAKGCRSLRSKNGSSCHVLFYGEFTVYHRGDKLWLSETFPIRDFYDIGMGIEALALYSYFFEILGYVCFENEDCGEILRLLLNMLHVTASDRSLHSLTRAKTVFELRCAAELGFAPEFVCSVCGSVTDPIYINVLSGDCFCVSCRNKSPEERSGAALSEAVRLAAAYIVNSPLKRIFSFSLEDDALAELSLFTEQYIINCTEHRYQSLDYYKGLL